MIRFVAWRRDSGTRNAFVKAGTRWLYAVVFNPAGCSVEKVAMLEAEYMTDLEELPSTVRAAALRWRRKGTPTKAAVTILRAARNR